MWKKNPYIANTLGKINIWWNKTKSLISIVTNTKDKLNTTEKDFLLAGQFQDFHCIVQFVILLIKIWLLQIPRKSIAWINQVIKGVSVYKLRVVFVSIHEKSVKIVTIFLNHNKKTSRFINWDAFKYRYLLLEMSCPKIN